MVFWQVGVELLKVVVEVGDDLEEIAVLEGAEEKVGFGGFKGAESEVELGVVFGGFIRERGRNGVYFERMKWKVGEGRELFAEVFAEGVLAVENKERRVHAELGGEGEEVGLGDLEVEDLVEGFEDGGVIGRSTAEAGGVGDVFFDFDVEVLGDSEVLAQEF